MSQRESLFSGLSPTHSDNSKGNARNFSFLGQGDPEDDDFNLEFGELDLTTDEIDFREVDSDLIKFQKDKIVQEALSKGVDLGNYSRQIEMELKEAESLCVADYLKEADNLAELHGQIKTCDSILESMQRMLSKFHSDLGTISSEIKHLQEQSNTMNVKLKNRQTAGKELSEFIKSIYISENLISLIIEGEVNEEYAHALQELNRIIKNLSNPSIASTRAVHDVIGTAKRLRAKAMARVRSFLLQRFYALKKPQTNIQIKQKLLEKCSYCYQFLKQNSVNFEGDISLEIRNNYVETMAKIYYSKFRAYLNNMKKIQQETTIRKKDLLGTDESKSSNFFGTKKTPAQMDRIFSMGQRDSVLTHMDPNYILPHVSQHAGQRFPYERIFQSTQRLLMDTAPSEYDFICKFFGDAKSTQERQNEQQTPSSRIRGSPTVELKSVVIAGAQLLDKTLLYKLMVTPVDGDPWLVIKRYSSFITLHQSIAKEDPELAALLPSLPGKKYALSPSAHFDMAHIESRKIGLENYLTAITDSGLHSIALKQFLTIDDGLHARATARRRSLPVQEQTKRMFYQIFNKTFSIFFENLDEYLFNCFDAIGLLILIRIVCQHNRIIQAKGSHCLNEFFDQINMILWPRFKTAFDLNVESIRKLKPIVRKQGPTQPLFMTARYAEYVSAIRKLNRGYDDEILSSYLRKLRDEIEKTFLQAAAKLSVPKIQIILLINNYNLIINILQNNRIESQETTHFKELVASKAKMYVEEELSERFGRLITCVKNTERLLTNSKGKDSTQIGVDYSTIESVAKGFAKYWRDGIEEINLSVKRSFTLEPNDNLSNVDIKILSESTSTDMLKQVLIQLVLYYERFQQIIKNVYRTRPPFAKDLIGMQTILYEMKKYGARD